MSTSDAVTYPRLVFRTRRASAILLAVQCAIMLSMVIVRGVMGGRPPLEWVSLGVFALLPVLVTGRILTLLQRIELHKTACDDDVRLALFDLSLVLPFVGYLPLLFVVGRL